jgi:hypothetical protein
MNTLTKDEKLYINEKVVTFIQSDKVKQLADYEIFKIVKKYVFMMYKAVKTTQKGKEALKLAKKFGGTYISVLGFNFKIDLNKTNPDNIGRKIQLILNADQSIQITAGDNSNYFSQKIEIDYNTYKALHNLEEKSKQFTITRCYVVPGYRYVSSKYDGIEKYYITFTTWEVQDSQRLAKIDELIELIKSDIIKNIKDYVKEALDESSN